jgi:hypothetical protein
MFFAGLIMMTRNRFAYFYLPIKEMASKHLHRFLAWPAIIFAINSFVNQHPLRSKDGAIAGGWNNILCVHVGTLSILI